MLSFSQAPTTDPAENSAKTRIAIVAASVGTVFEWYDFFLYGSLAVFFSAYFFPPGNESSAFLAALATFGAGFAVRPIGALIFGALGDRIGRKRSFQITMVIMGASTFAVGLLPSYAQVGLWAPVLLVALRLAQGLAVGGEYGGAATYVAEYAPEGRRGYATSWLQTTSTVAFLLSLVVVLVCRVAVGDEAFKQWGWRIPFLSSAALLAVSVYIRLKLEESPIFEKMKAEGRASRRPIAEAFGRWDNVKRMLILLFGITTGMTVVWYTAQFYCLFFLQTVLQVDYKTSCLVFTVGLILGTPLIVVAGALSDRIGRKRIMVTGLVLAALTLMPSFRALARFTNPALIAFSEATPITIAGDAGTFSVFAKPSSDADKARSFFIRNGLSYEFTAASDTPSVITQIGARRLEGFDESTYKGALAEAGFKAQPAQINFVGTVAVIVWMLALVGMVYGPMAAFMVELFPARIRSTSLSLPYHLGVGILGGFLPFVASALTVYHGNIFAGLWYPIVIAGVTAIVGWFILPETKDADIG
ncbi:MAG: MFS transporter [Opitutaceae bacterium]|nr:MFS transporter [Opitutaceae bacterium]